MTFDLSLPLLIRCIDKRFIQRAPSEVTHLRQITEQIVQLGGIILSCTGRIPFIPINLKAVKGGFGTVLVIGNLGGYACINSLSYLRLFEDYKLADSKEERALLRKTPHAKLKSLILISSLAISAIAQVRSVALAYRYNGNSIGMAVWILLGDSSRPICSTKISLEKGLSSYSHDETETRLNKVNHLVCQLLEIKRELFAQMSPNERIILIKKLKSLTQEKDLVLRVSNYLKLIFDGVELNRLLLTPAQKNEKISMQLIGGNLSLAQMISWGLVTYQESSSLFCSPIARGLLAASVIGANVYLNGNSIIKTCLKISQSIRSYFQHTYTPSITTQLRPTLNYLLPFMGFLIATIAWGPSVQVNRDYAQGGLSLYLQISVSIAISLFVMYCATKLSERIASKSICRWGTDEEKSIIQFDIDLQQLIRLFQGCSPSDFVSLILYLPKRLKSELLQKYNLSEEMISAYFSKKQSATEMTPLLEDQAV